MVLYRVSINETIISVAYKLRLPVGLIIKWNNLTEEIEEGDVLIIEDLTQKKYLVNAGDTFYSISKALNVSEKYLKETNNTEYLTVNCYLAY